MPTYPKITILGGGIIGLSIGWQLVRSGFPVSIFDEGKKGASPVAAGMLAPSIEAIFENRIDTDALLHYPQFLQELEADSGISIPLGTCGSLLVCLNRDDHSEFRGEMSGDAARDIEPLLSPRVVSATFFPNDCHIEPKLLLTTLENAFVSLGGKIIHSSAPSDCRPLIVATGAYSQGILPNKGQILTMRSKYPLKVMVRTPRVYLVSKNDGIVRIGATSEMCGFDARVTGYGVRTLLQEAFEVIPSVDEMELLSIDAAFRPLARNNQPLIEERETGVYVATGHGRAGFLLAPLTAYRIKEMLWKYC